jgi:hypothetical protein
MDAQCPWLRLFHIQRKVAVSICQLLLLQDDGVYVTYSMCCQHVPLLRCCGAGVLLLFQEPYVSPEAVLSTTMIRGVVR